MFALRRYGTTKSLHYSYFFEYTSRKRFLSGDGTDYVKFLKLVARTNLVTQNPKVFDLPDEPFEAEDEEVDGDPEVLLDSDFVPE